MLNIFITIFCKNIRYSIRILKRKLVKSKLITNKEIFIIEKLQNIIRNEMTRY